MTTIKEILEAENDTVVKEHLLKLNVKLQYANEDYIHQATTEKMKSRAKVLPPILSN